MASYNQLVGKYSPPESWERSRIQRLKEVEAGQSLVDSVTVEHNVKLKCGCGCSFGTSQCLSRVTPNVVADLVDQSYYDFGGYVEKEGHNTLDTEFYQGTPYMVTNLCMQKCLKPMNQTSAYDLEQGENRKRKLLEPGPLLAFTEAVHSLEVSKDPSTDWKAFKERINQYDRQAEIS
ncbi:hypothetical protein K435DRAFT_811106 [Dendrothele bispora CBS 962.96]|uniref:Uncharacterized protein n=1 Tax=Dendrothele bispora (strain CBS 962.96) TaxID=1314807 RepID=A0A4S8KU32_DENBC|nr:hypothetical protein K435DRAFT_811106 [Dendrothele bispora CBS 962.96]